jgi:hypothetical protein
MDNVPIPTSVVPPPPNQPTNNNQLPGASKLFGQAWHLYINKFWLLTGIFLVPIFIIAIGVAGYFAAAKAGLDLGALYIILAIILLIAAIYYGVWAGAAMLQAIEMEINNSEPVSFAAAFHNSKGKMWAVMGAALLFGLAVGGGTILLIIPGVIFYVWFALSPYAVISEGLRDTKALGASKRLVQGKFWVVFWRWLFLGIIYVVAAFVLAIIIGFFHLQDNVSTFIERTVLDIIFTPFTAVYGYLIYTYLKNSVPQAGQ